MIFVMIPPFEQFNQGVDRTIEFIRLSRVANRSINSIKNDDIVKFV
jgi:hypothetical protein